MRMWKPAAAVAGLWALGRLRAGWDPKDKVVLITGGGRGLGLELARAFGAEGARLVLCARGEEALAKAQGELSRKGIEVHTRLCDVRDQDEVERLVSECVNRFGRLDCIVNNAGIIQVGPAETMSLEDFQAAMDANFWGSVHVTLAALPHLEEVRGRIVNITSIGGAVAVPHLVPYTASKFAMVGFSTGLAAEVEKRGVRVTTVLPGLMRTGSFHHALVKGQRPKEATWFALGASLPGVTINAQRAARRIVRACRSGRRFVTLGLPAKVLRLGYELAPNPAIALFSVVNRLLPAANGAQAAPSEATYHPTKLSKSFLTYLGNRAAARNNERVQSAPD